ncbi:hypothetical protein CVT24_002535 [Panaeolus cyanescens]|uniref:Uncharacterized protein n=1 Tax=Panaeolus cyanescens TaxID=181874 RepID=A0A409WB01_9AGAR|nr:hypothetical protein CVT24_002535 [Panaeolus cyanescens]
MQLTDTLLTSVRELNPNNIVDFVADPEEPVSRVPTLTARPSYVRNLFWNPLERPSRITLANWSIHAPPLPPIPVNELRNKPAIETISSHPELFRITTPIKPAALEAYLVNHPNRDFVASIIDGLTNGFWPWADTTFTILPYKLDVKEYLQDPDHLLFANQQREVEIEEGRFSPSFDELLPGMLAVPVHVVPKPHPNKLRLVVNHSSEPFVRNALIDKVHVSVPLDTVQDLGFRRPLDIIGFHVDTEAMTITMPEKSRNDLIKALRDFAVPGNRLRLCEFQAIAGWVNWALNAYPLDPLLRPALSAIYAKMAGKTKAFAEVRVNSAICRELHWAPDHLEVMDGVYLISACDWEPDQADFTKPTETCTMRRNRIRPKLQEVLQCLKYSRKQKRLDFNEGYLAREEDYAIDGRVTVAALQELLELGKIDEIQTLLAEAHQFEQSNLDT